MASTTATKFSQAPTLRDPATSRRASSAAQGIVGTWEERAPASSVCGNGDAHSSDLLTQLLALRGVAASQAEAFLNPSYAQLRRFGGSVPLRDLDAAVQVLARAVRDRGAIVVFGDYDVDGVCGTALMCDVLTRLGARPVPLLPHRERDGYGLQLGSVPAILAHAPTTVVTVDNGSSSAAAVADLKRRGIPVVIADHHEIHGQPPAADALVNPRRSDERAAFRGLCATGVAFRIAEALYDQGGVADGQEKWLLDLAALATVCDMVPLVGDNRAIVRFGLRTLERTRRVGLRALLDSSGSAGRITAEHLGFRLGPRLNAAGRLVHAERSLKLVQAHDAAEAAQHVEHVEQLNRERQQLTKRVVAEARLAAREFLDQPSLVLTSKDWPRGVCGLAAGRLAEELGRPVFVLEQGEPCVGSGRSVPGVDLAAALDSMRPLFDRAGGHAAAAGCTLRASKLGDFRQQLAAFTAAARPEGPATRTLQYDATARLADINAHLLDLLAQLEPFGMGNPRPLLRIDDCTVTALRKIGADGSHMSFTFTRGSERRRAVAWGKAEQFAHIGADAQVDVLAYVRENDWRGIRSAELEVADLRPR